jgi:hypothetical protein
MNPLWIGLSIIHDGLPCLNPTIVPTLTSSILVNNQKWPCNSRHQPKSASQGAQIRTYTEGHFNVSVCSRDTCAGRACSTCEIFSCGQ